MKRPPSPSSHPRVVPALSSPQNMAESSQSIAGKPLRILICRLSHIGDCLLTLPLLRALRQAYPQSFIAWAVEKPTHTLLANHPDLDELIIVDRSWMKRPSSFIATRRRMQSYRFNITLDPQSICKSALLAWTTGAKNRLGFSGVHGRELSKWFNNRLTEPSSTHLVDRSLELLSLLGIPVSPPQFHLPLDPAADDFIQTWFTDSHSSRPFVAVNPGASWPSKQWECDRFAKVAHQLAAEFNITSVVTWAGDQEKSMAEQIVADAAGAAVLAPATTLPQLTALFKRAQLFVGCDTGPLHLAATVGTPCVGLHGPTRPQDSGAYGPKHASIQSWYQAGTSRQRRGGANDAMRDISVAQVVDACRSQLANRFQKSA